MGLSGMLKPVGASLIFALYVLTQYICIYHVIKKNVTYENFTQHCAPFSRVAHIM